MAVRGRIDAAEHHTAPAEDPLRSFPARIPRGFCCAAGCSTGVAGRA